MKRYLIVIGFFTVSLLAKHTSCGVFPCANELGMKEDDYFQLMGFTGLICGSLFTFLLTR